MLYTVIAHEYYTDHETGEKYDHVVCSSSSELYAKSKVKDLKAIYPNMQFTCLCEMTLVKKVDVSDW